MTNLEAKKSLGQNFLTNPKVPEWMADAGKVKKGSVVLEIGPGTGMLTRELLARGAQVVAIEADPRAMEILHETFPEAIKNRKLLLIHGDIREMTAEDIPVSPHEYTLVANIPYYLSGHLFRFFLSGNIQPKTLVFLVQKEVAVRIARDEKESLLSLSVKAFGTPQYIKTISKGNFRPQPKVDSAIIAVTDISHDNFRKLPEPFFFKILHLGLSAKRKMLLGSLAKEYDRDTLKEIFTKLDIPLTVRGEDLPVNRWFTLIQTLYTTFKQ
ncbi:16S rRNA (adenine(1518)-N(6)/adenine(1519)-N(6))-dimethyltransferase RsmA [Candidatus Kaiserbacteria bacterium]|nr:16S rRNA (adenine(1518)-N(6)/adenine(1519)-N(6))-dimethyltransferase RsmA [Candidatus Kaiserbacteria bacterium]